MFHDANGSVLDKLIANFLRMVLFIILAGYLLVITKLFEVIGILGVVIIWTLFQQSRHSVRNVSSSYAIAVLFDLIELPQTSIQFIKKLPSRVKELSSNSIQWLQKLRLTSVTVTILFAIIVISISIWMRLYVGVTDPTPKMSDGDYLLAWIKYIDLRYLMHDGLYPQGYFFYMAVLGKFAVINPLYVLNFTGPLNSVLILITMYYFVKKVTQSQLAALVSITIYGILGQSLLFGEWVRQSGSETQEFGFIFAFPTMYFLHRYLETKQKTDFWVAVAGLSDAGLVHPVAYVMAFIGCFAVLFAHIISKGKNIITQLPLLILWGIASGAMALIPYGLAFIYKLQPAPMNQNFLTSKVTVPIITNSHTIIGKVTNFIALLQPVSGWDIVAIGCIILLTVISFWGWIHNRPDPIWILASLLGLVSYFIYEFGVAITKSYLVSTRMIDVWAIFQAAIIGFGVAVIVQKLKVIHRRSWIKGLSAFSVVTCSLVTVPPKPIIPYDMQWKSDVNAYLKINQQYEQLGYMIVSPDYEYALVLGQGYHMQVSDFVKEFNPDQKPLTLRGSKGVDHSLAPYVFLYVYKHIFSVPKTLGVYSIYAPQYKIETFDNQRLLNWIQSFKKSHPGNLSVYFQTKNLVVYKIKVGL